MFENCFCYIQANNFYSDQPKKTFNQMYFYDCHHSMQNFTIMSLREQCVSSSKKKEKNREIIF